MKRTVQLGAAAKIKTRTMYVVQQLAAVGTGYWVATGAQVNVLDRRWTGSIYRFKSKRAALVKSVELRLLDEHGNQYRVARVRVRKT